MKFRNHFASRIFAIIITLALLLPILCAGVTSTHAQQADGSTFTLDNVGITVRSAVFPGNSFTVAEAGAADQVATSVSFDPYRELTITTVPFGRRPGSEALPRAAHGGPRGYVDELRQFREQQGAQVQDAPSVQLFGRAVSGIQSTVMLFVDGPVQKPILIDEWAAEANGHLWIVRASEEQLAETPVASQSAALAAGLAVDSATSGNSLSIAGPTLDTSVASEVAPASGEAQAFSAAATADLPAATWWNGDCDTNTYANASNNPQHRAAYRLGAVYLGMPACGPRPWADSAPDVMVRFFPNAWGALEWECVELSMRFLYLKYGISPYSANGSQVVSNYSGSRLVKVWNGTVGKAPQQNDVLSYGSTSTFGHTSVVTNSAVDGSGNGTLTIIEQNNTDSGSNTLAVVNWTVQGNAGAISGWLHDPTPPSPNINVQVNGALAGTYYVPAGGSLRQSYTDVDAGPVKIVSTDGTAPMIASERINLKSGTGYSSYSEFMGVPASKLSDTYLFPWYNNAAAGGLASELRFANVGAATTTVTVTIAGVVRGTYLLARNTSTRVTYTDVDDGPVRIQSAGGVTIVASERINLKTLPQYLSYTELLGLSACSTASTKYMFPWYNNAGYGGLDSQLRFGNVGAGPTTVYVKIGGIARGSYPLDPNKSTRITYTDVDSGPVEVYTTNGVPIIASERINLTAMPGYNSYTELMGLPGITLTETRYLFPIYTDTAASGLEGQLRFGNVGTANTTVTVKIAGAAQGSYPLAPNASMRVTLADVNDGPVEVSSSGGVPIIASMRVNMLSNESFTSNAEMMGLSMGTGLGLPGNELSPTYWFPWYNNSTYSGLDSQLRFGVP